MVKKKLYFGPEVDEAIIKFRKTQDEKERNELCKEFIYPALERISSYWFNKLPLNNEDLIYDCLADLYEKLSGFDETKGTRAFAYFNMIARNFMYQQLKLEKREVAQDQDRAINVSDINVLENDSLIDEEIDLIIENREFLSLFREELEVWEKRATKDREIKVVQGLIQLFENVDNIDIYKKKAILFYLRELTGYNSKQIALVISKLKKKYKKFKKKYQRGDI